MSVMDIVHNLKKVEDATVIRRTDVDTRFGRRDYVDEGGHHPEPACGSSDG